MVSDGYAPIEQYLSQAPRTPATDVYGLAATLYFVDGKSSVAVYAIASLYQPRDLQLASGVAVNQAVIM